jgi:hypothetical protein
VKKGQTVCIIEAMKLMNEIEVRPGYSVENNFVVEYPGQGVCVCGLTPAGHTQQSGQSNCQRQVAWAHSGLPAWVRLVTVPLDTAVGVGASHSAEQLYTQHHLYPIWHSMA